MNFNDAGVFACCEEPISCRLFAVGDVIPGGRTEEYFRTGNLQKMLGETKQLFTKADFVLFNLETPLCLQGSPIPKCGGNHRVHPDCAYGLKSAGFNVAALANNHILDYGRQGLTETLSALDGAGIAHHGAGNSPEEATKPLQIKSGDLRITFLNFAEGEFSSIESGSGSGAATIDLMANSSSIRQARASSDLVIVSVHAGNEYQHFPSPWIQRLYRSYIELGADAVIAHHPHIPQGIEFYNNRVIVYSLGDFMFEFLNDPGTRITFALEIQFTKKEIKSVHIHPMRKADDGGMVFLLEKEKQLFVHHMNSLSDPLNRPDKLEILYSQGILKRFETFYSGKLKQNLPLSLSKKKQKDLAAAFMLNMFNCPSHIEALRTVFSMLHEGRYGRDTAVQRIISELNYNLETLGRHRMPELGSVNQAWTGFFPRLAKRIAHRMLFVNR
jgi:poly-gamma-glutamate synthesis protein (capsule biosynthesis protein)